MDGLEICFRDRLMALAACIHDLEPEDILVGPFNGMRGMTIIACR